MRNTYIASLLVLFAICLPYEGNAQTDTFTPKGSFSFDIGIPANPRNSAFRRIMEGLFNGGVDYQYNVYKGLTLGVGAKYAFFTINPFAFNNIPISGGYQVPSLYMHVGYEKFTTERILLSASVRGGYGLMMSFNDSCRVNHGGQYISDAFFVEPQLEASMLVERNSPHAFSAVLGYSIYFHEFSKEEVCIDQIPNLTKESYQGLTRFLSIGFGYRYYFGRN